MTIPMTLPLVTYALDENVAIIGLNRPEKRNAASAEMISDLRDAVVRATDEASAAVLFGHGDNFCAGLDLAEMAARYGPNPPKMPKRPVSPWHQTVDLIARGGVPFVAALHGATIGGGLEIASAAHIRVADQTTFFGLPEGQRGIFVGGGGTVNIQRILGYETMADMMLTGRLLNAEEGKTFKLVQYLVEPGAVLAKATELARRIATNLTLTNWQITNVLPRINDMSHDDGLFVEMLNAHVTRPPESAERLREFLQKRSEPLKRGQE